ncbi:MAG TPA: chemotaxis protein CheW [Nitrospira sp.]|jgi:chemotaxis signal transduction protein|nr:chemotaxis protein CheW [Nitrospira sp.]
MLRSQLRNHAQAGPIGNAEARMQAVVVFSVAGQRLAVRSDEVGGVMPWPGAIAVPSDTPCVAALVRQDTRCLPVFDLAAKFRRAMHEESALCLIVKHIDGPLAICIDPQVPSLHMVARSSMHYQSGSDPDIAGTCVADEEELPIINLTTLGVSSIRTGK